MTKATTLVFPDAETCLSQALRFEQQHFAFLCRLAFRPVMAERGLQTLSVAGGV